MDNNPPSGYQEVSTRYPFRVARLKPGSFLVGRVNAYYFCPVCGWKSGTPRESTLGAPSHWFCTCGQDLGKEEK